MFTDGPPFRPRNTTGRDENYASQFRIKITCAVIDEPYFHRRTTVDPSPLRGKEAGKVDERQAFRRADVSLRSCFGFFLAPPSRLVVSQDFDKGSAEERSLETVGIAFCRKTWGVGSVSRQRTSLTPGITDSVKRDAHGLRKRNNFTVPQ